MTKNRKALTIIEVLVVLFCIGMLVLLMLPATRSVGGSARRNNCSNQTRQLLLGCLNRENATQHFPLAMAGQLAANRIDTHRPAPMNTDDGYSFLVPVLAYIEESALSEEIYAASNDLSEPITSSNFIGDRAHLFDRPVELVICPSFPGENIAQGNYSPTTPQVSNYHAVVAGCAKGPNRVFGDLDSRTGGVIVTKQASEDGLAIKDVVDGTSKTLLISESRAETWTAWFSGASVSTIAFSPEVASCSDFLGEARNDALPLGLNYGSSDESRFFWNRQNDKRAWGPSSAHAGDVVMSGFADGHVQPLNGGISARTYFQLATRGGGPDPEFESE